MQTLVFCFLQCEIFSQFGVERKRGRERARIIEDMHHETGEKYPRSTRKFQGRSLVLLVKWWTFFLFLN